MACIWLVMHPSVIIIVYAQTSKPKRVIMVTKIVYAAGTVIEINL